MNRRALKLVVFLLLGAIINVAVAWGFAMQWRFESNIGLSDRSRFSQHAAHNELSVGLPFRALEGRRDSALWQGEEIHSLWVLPRSRPKMDIYLPFQVIWPGFAINTMFYAAIAWFLFFAPRAIRRRVRRKRGQCAACGYSLRGSLSNICPECEATK